MGLIRDFGQHFARWLCGFALAVALLSPASAGAQDARTRARAAFGEGVTAYEAGRYREALASFEQAYRAAPHPAVRVNMANCFEQLGQYVEALFNFRRYLEESGENVDEEQREEVEIAIARLTPRVATLVFNVEPRNATLTIDGKEPRRTPDGRVQVVAGVHAVRAAAPGFVPVERSVDARGGSDTPVMLTLELEGAAPVAPLDEALPEEPPPEPAAVEPAEVPEEAPPESDEPPRRKTRVWLWTAVSATGLLAVGTGVAGIIALQADKDFEDADARSKDPNLTDFERQTARYDGVLAADRANNAALMSDIFLGATVVAGAASVWIWLAGRNDDVPAEEASLSVRPLYSRRGGAGLGLGGRF